MNTQVSTSLVQEPPVWFITGCSTGFGLELAKQAIDRGYRTVMTARDPAKLQGYGATDNVLVLKLDVTQPDQIAATIHAAEARFGGIDVLVNNAGIGYFAAIEEGVDDEVLPLHRAELEDRDRLVHPAEEGVGLGEDLHRHPRPVAVGEEDLAAENAVRRAIGLKPQRMALAARARRPATPVASAAGDVAEGRGQARRVVATDEPKGAV